MTIQGPEHASLGARGSPEWPRDSEEPVFIPVTATLRGRRWAVRVPPGYGDL